MSFKKRGSNYIKKNCNFAGSNKKPPAKPGAVKQTI